MIPICLDFYAGLGGWAEGFLSENYECIGFDIERHDYGTGGYPGQLVLQDIRTLHGSQFASLGDRLRCFVASPPCTEYSYMAMPWKRAKQIARALRGQDSFPSGYKGSRSIEELNLLFNECFRLQREASEAAGRHIPLIVENVKGAQPWVGRAPWNFGSFYLWGDVPALMPIVRRAQKLSGFRFDGSGKSFQSEAVKQTGQDWSRFAKTGEVSPHWRMEAQKNNGGSWFNIAHNTASGKGRNPDGRKANGSWFGNYAEAKAAGRGSGNRYTSSNSVARARASAEIAKIPFPLAQHIARIFKPLDNPHQTERADAQESRDVCVQPLPLNQM